MKTEIETKTAFHRIRYAQVWEDGNVLMEAFGSASGGRGLSIASAGDNALLMLARDPDEVLAVDINPAQLACLEIRVAALQTLERDEVLGLIGSRAMPPRARTECYRRCRPLLGESARRFWDAHPRFITRGIGGCGKFEGYFHLFRKMILPLAHNRHRVEALLTPRTPQERAMFFEHQWNTTRWRMIFHLFFSRFVMGCLGRSPQFFEHVEGPVASRILKRVSHALIVLDPSQNPWLHWILTGSHTRLRGETVLPPWLEEGAYRRIVANLGRLKWRRSSVEEVLSEEKCGFDHFNLSDIFEYMSPARAEWLLEKICERSSPGARLVYWNMLAPRSRPERLANRLVPVTDLTRMLHEKDRGFFYSRLVIEDRI